MISVLPREYKTLVVLLTQGDLNQLTPTTLLGKLAWHEHLLKDYEGESPSSNKNIAFKAKSESIACDSDFDDGDGKDSDDMALLMRKTRRVVKKIKW